MRIPTDSMLILNKKKEEVETLSEASTYKSLNEFQFEIKSHLRISNRILIYVKNGKLR